MKILKNLFKGEKEDKSAIQVDKKTIERFISNPDFPYFISFPRTGSHWIRMVMELYFEKPSLVRVFYYHKSEEFTCYHWHDLDLNTRRKRIIYLYRNPVDTIFSLMNYHTESLGDTSKIKDWAKNYSKHLSWWLLEETTSNDKVLLKYENFKQNFHSEFLKIVDFFGESFDENKLNTVLMKVSKEKLKVKTKDYNDKVVNVDSKYFDDRIEFKKKNSDLIYSIVENKNRQLLDYVQG